MEEKSFDLLIESIEEMEQHIKGDIKLKTTSYEIAEIPNNFTPETIKRIRIKMGMTEKVFAKFMGVRPRSVEAWEGGQNTPSGPARRMLSMLQDEKLAMEMTEKFIVKS